MAEILHEERFVGAADWVTDVGGAFQHGFGQVVHHELFEHVQWKEWTRHEIRL